MPTCRPGSRSWMAFSPGDKRNTAKVAKDTSTSPLSVKPLRGARHQRFGTGTTTIAPQVPEQVLVPDTVPSQTHRQLSTLYHSDRTPR
jgi:hypothetical protein